MGLLDRIRGPQQQAQTPKSVSGSINRVPCPHCGAFNDMRELDGQQLLDTGHEVQCDSCGNIMEVAQIRVVKVVSVRKSQGGPQRRPGGPSRGQVAAPRQATTLSPGQTRRLLGR